MTNKTARLSAIPLALLLAAGLAAQSPLHPDTIYVNATVITMDPSARTVEAVAVKGDTIAAVGSNGEIRAMAGSGTNIIDLGGKVLLPGFIDAHSHFPGAGIDALYLANLNSPPVGPIQNIDDVVKALKKKAETTPKGQWILGRGYDQTLLAEKRHPTRYDLDKVSTEHPIIITHTSGHLSVANSKALELGHITKDTPQPKGAHIQKDPKTGEPNGVLEEGAGGLGRLIPPRTVEERMEGVKRAVAIYTAAGVTTSVIAGGGKQSLLDLQEASRRGLLPFRITSMASRSARGPSAGEEGGFVTGFGSPMLRLGAVKIVHDGSIQGYTGYLSKPYHVPLNGDKTYRGYPRESREELVDMVRTLHKAGYQIAIHANGDAAIDDVIYAFREAQKELPRPDARHRIEHCQMARMDQLDAMRELGITPSFFVSHTFYWGDQHRDIFMGPERAAHMSPLAAARKRDVRFSIHLDTDVTPMSPLQAVWSAVNRITRSGKVVGPEESIAPLEALRAVTSDAAWQNVEEKVKGSIEPGKLADFVVLAENPLTVDPIKIRDIGVLETIVGGKTVYQRGTSSSGQP